MSDKSKPQPTTKDRLREAVSNETTASLAAAFGGTPFYSHDATASEAFLCRELDDIRKQLSTAQWQLAVLGAPEPPASGECEHRKVFSSQVLCTYPAQHPWICSQCGAEGTDRDSLPTGPTYDELAAKKKERSR